MNVLLEARLDELLKGHQQRQQAVEKANAKTIERWNFRVNEYIRQSTRRIVRETKRKALARTSKWEFTSDETDIPQDADFQRVQDVLDTIGRGDEFRALIDKAYTEVAIPNGLVAAMADSESTENLEEVASQLKKARKKSKTKVPRF